MFKDILFNPPMKADFQKHVSPYFEDELIKSYCVAIDEKEQKGLCCSDMKETLLHLIYRKMNDKSPKQIEIAQFVLDNINSYDSRIEKAWNQLKEVPCMKEDNEKISEEFYFWTKGTCKYEIWEWFDFHHSKGIGYLVNEFKG